MRNAHATTACIYYTYTIIIIASLFVVWHECSVIYLLIFLLLPVRTKEIKTKLETVTYQKIAIFFRLRLLILCILLTFLQYSYFCGIIIVLYIIITSLRPVMLGLSTYLDKYLCAETLNNAVLEYFDKKTISTMRETNISITNNKSRQKLAIL